MPELRKDPVLGRWVIIASERERRPSDFPAEKEPPSPPPGMCPFCEGSEGKTPPEIAAYRPGGGPANSPGWTIRVVPNKYPALRVEGSLDKKGEGIYDRMNGIGAHEVLIETGRHARSLTDVSPEQAAEVVRAYQERLLDLRRDRRLVYGLVFKNVGATAGASLEHTHSQLIATPTVPRIPADEIAGARRYYDYRGRCIYCDMWLQEVQSGSRVVIETSAHVAFAPFAPRFAFETWVLPKNHASDFGTITPSERADLGRVLRETLRRLETSLSRPPYNYVLHTAPFDVPEMPHYHWHIEVIPRITKVAGFEWGAGFYINPVPPERAAAYLREAVPEARGA